MNKKVWASVSGTLPEKGQTLIMIIARTVKITAARGKVKVLSNHIIIIGRRKKIEILWQKSIVSCTRLSLSIAMNLVFNTQCKTQKSMNG